MSAPLLERERELAVIDEKLDEAAAGRGGVVVIEGAAGIGKSALAARAREPALERGFAVAVARGSELERANAFGVVRQLFEPRLRAISPARRERALAGAAELAAPVVLPETAPPDATGGSSFGTLHGLYWLLAGFAAERPQLLVVDDLHWADEGSVRFLQFLANRAGESPVLLLAAQRPEGGALRAAPDAVTLAPRALSPAATSQALAGGERDGVAPAFATAVHAATGGNPLLVRRLADGLRERGVPFTEAGAGDIASAGPDAVAGAVEAAMARLGREPVALARAVAILGDEAPLAVAAPLAGLAPDGGAAADQLVRAGILDDGRPLHFQHALVRDAVLASLTAGERAAAHLDAARQLEDRGAPERVIAAHLLHTEPSSDARVAAALATEGRRALAAGAPSEARGMLARALAEPPAEADRYGLLLALARAETHLGDGDAIEHIQAAYDAAGDELERAQAALAVMWAAGPAPEQVVRAIGLIEPAIEGMAGGDRELRLQLEAARLMMLFLSEDQIGTWIEASERHAGLEGATAGECLLLLHASIARFASGRSAAEIATPVERIPENAAALAALGPEAPWVPFLIGMLFKTDRLDAADVIGAAALDEATRIGSAAGFAIASVWHGWIALRRGDGAAAEAHARAALDAVPPGGWQHHFCSAGLAEVLVERMQLDEAARVLDLVHMDGIDPADRSSELLFSTRSIVRMARGDAAAALEDQREARRRRGGETEIDPDFPGWVRIARLLHATGDDAGAREEAGAALAYARRFGTPGYIGQALTVSGVLQGGAEGLGQLREAVAELERSPARRELALALVELGGALRRDGQRAAAREPLRRALDLAAAGGLTATAERAREELRATGARVRRDHATGVASLTPSERRIAERAAAGASNPEIAQALFVTTKTVEMHLSRAYRKLEIGSRDGLPAALREG